VFVGREVGGDFYDVIKSGDSRAGVLIGDVSGKGLESAALAATTRSTIHAFVHESQSPGEVLDRTNSVLRSQQRDFESFVTVLLVTINLSTGEIAYSSAGHPPGAILRVGGSVEFLSIGNLPLGIMDSIGYTQSAGRLDPGDKLVLYTDGISEARSRAGLFELEGIKELLSGHSSWTSEEVADKLIAAATDWADGKLRDDAGVVVVERQRK
jgi:serine phosphatase RsbU (regulator of sigma subunit)